MSIRIIEQMRDYLQRHGPASVQEVVQAIPDLEECGGAERALLLMRLDPNLEPTQKGLWTVRDMAINHEKRIQEAATKYFCSIGRPGAPLSSAVEYIQKETNVDLPEIREALAKYYVVYGSNIFNQRKGKEED
jgi:hypothetical protein